MDGNEWAAEETSFVPQDDFGDDRIVVVDVAEFIAMQLKPRETILAPWLPTQGLVMVYAERGVGKTFFQLAAGLAIASGGEFLGWKADKPRRVLYVDGEMPAVVMQERIAALVKGMASELPDPSYFQIITPDLLGDYTLNLAAPATQAALEPKIKDRELIMVDNISTLAPTKQDDGESWLPLQAWALQCRRAGKAVNFTHHAGKNTLQRGTSRREDVLDTVIALRHPQGYQHTDGARFKVEFEKNRGFYGEDAQAFEATMINNPDGGLTWTLATEEESRTEQVIRLHRDGYTQRQIATELHIGPATVNRHICKARRDGRLTDDA